MLQRVIRSVKAKQGNGTESHGAEVCASGSYSDKDMRSLLEGCSFELSPD